MNSPQTTQRSFSTHSRRIYNSYGFSIFNKSNLYSADLRGAQLNKCKFGGAILNGVKISIEQLTAVLDFDVYYIREHQIQVYMDEKLITGEELEEEYKKRRPVSYILNYYRHKYSQGNIKAF